MQKKLFEATQAHLTLSASKDTHIATLTANTVSSSQQILSLQEQLAAVQLDNLRLQAQISSQQNEIAQL
jgi:hypothetical protein